jgi:RNA polymerase sigma-70 factor (ECF subfamily)
MISPDALITALRGDGALETLLSRRARLTIDSGGAASFPAGVVTGRAPAAAALRELLGRFADPQPAAAEVNGAPGIVVRSGGRVVAVLAVHARRGRIAELWVVASPDKLRHWAPA